MLLLWFAPLDRGGPRLSDLEKEAGKPDYTALYTVDTPGQYKTKVSQLIAGGLFGQYFDNQFFYGAVGKVLQGLADTNEADNTLVNLRYRYCFNWK